jgi:hypothetical protein
VFGRDTVVAAAGGHASKAVYPAGDHQQQHFGDPAAAYTVLLLEKVQQLCEELAGGYSPDAAI